MYTIRTTTVERAGRDCRFRLRIDALHIEQGERIALVGPSGCGKSTALDLLAMLLPPNETAGFRFCPQEQEEDIAAHWEARRLDHMARLRLAHIGYILQTGGLLPFLTVQGNITTPGLALGLARTMLTDKLHDLTGRLGIEHLLDALPETLSIGERQRVAVARALLAEPEVVLADEPTAALDPVNAKSVMALLAGLTAERGATLVVVSHDEPLMRANGFRCLHLHVSGNENHILTTLRG